MFCANNISLITKNRRGANPVKKLEKSSEIVDFRGFLVRVRWLEHPTSTSQMSRPTNWATPGYWIENGSWSRWNVVWDRLYTKLKISATALRLVFQGVCASPLYTMVSALNTPKPGALPTALHPDIWINYSKKVAKSQKLWVGKTVVKKCDFDHN